MMKKHCSILLLFLLSVSSSTGLDCFSCFCRPTNTTACDCTNVVPVQAGSHCTIVQDLHSSDPYIEMSAADMNSSYAQMKDAYYVLVDEDIYRNDSTNTWETKTKRVVYGCDWDLCNRFSLIASLPQSYKLTIDSAWLESNIYGSGTVSNCNTCTNEICGNKTNPIDYDQCPSTTCTNATTCSLYNLWEDFDTEEACYQSQCTPSEIIDESSDANGKYNVQVEAIVYLAQNRSNFVIWQLNVNCAADNCTRSTIFQEIKQELGGDTSGIATFPATRPPTTPVPSSTISSAPTNPIKCYNCSCIGTVCPCTTYEVISADDSYCTIIRQNYGQFISVDYGHIGENTTHVYINEYPFVLVEESIIYDDKTGQWNTQSDIVVFGCNTSLCNSPDLLYYLPSSFQMRLPVTWLDANVRGNGSAVRDCHECPEAPQCGATDFLDAGRCPIHPCNTTCLVSDSFNDPAHGLLCYQSFCAPEDSEFLQIDTHRVEIEGVIYASRPSDVEIWEIDLYCRADDCSRPELFKELRSNLVVQPGDLSILFNQTTTRKVLRCFDCYCEGEVNCVCDTIAVQDAATNYCTITRTYDGSGVYVYFQHFEIGTSYSNVRELPFVLIDEAILYNNATGKWFTRTTDVTYACNVDYCNKPSLLQYLATSLEMTLPDAWLNSTLMSSGQSTLMCNECSGNATCSSVGSVDDSTCPAQACNTTCYVSNVYADPDTNEQCYQAFCTPDSSEFAIDYYRVEIEAIVYPSNPSDVELWETYIYCQAENCSRPGIFQEIKQHLDYNRGNLSELFNNTAVGDPGKLHCYDCYCENEATCTCNKTLALPDNATYCTIIREYDGQDFWIILEHIDRNSSRIYIQELPYMLVEESILYDDNYGIWVTRPNIIVYGCNTDFCNDPRLIPHLPTDFRMRLPEDWLEANVRGNGTPVRDCHECPDAPQCGQGDFLDAGRCPIHSCNTTCLVFDVFDDPSVDEQCYQSFCAPPDTDEYHIDTHRVEIEGILYGNRPNAELELWEVDLYCRADDCSRPTIFQELEAKLTVDLGDLSEFFNITTIATTPLPTTTPITPVEPPLACYECSCADVSNCECDKIGVSGAYSSYCTIVRVNYDMHFTIDLEHIDRNSTRVYIRKFPYMLAEESILYNETTGVWWTRSNILVYGCNTSLCNHPSRVALLPDSFKMFLSDEWLNKNVRGNGSAVRDCHECPDAPQCGTTSFLDASRCPVHSCNTTCVVSDTFNDPSDDKLCFQSYCNPPDVDAEEDRHRVELEGIIYKDNPSVVELWEIDIYCRADDCSRPEIFDELRGNLTTQTNNLTALFNDSILPTKPQLICYDCYLYDEPVYECNTYSIADADSSYCVIVRANYGDEDYDVILEHIDRNSTRVYVRKFPYLLVEESILYNDSTKAWRTRTNLVVYGCKEDYCNHPSYIEHLPGSFQMGLPDTWLNDNVLGTGQSVRDCHECPEAPQCGATDFLDAGRCPIHSCNTTCLVSDIYSDPDSDEQCYQSYCAPPDSEFFTIDPHRVEMEGILYVDCVGAPVEIWEIDLFCRADDCSRPEIFKEIREKFTTNLNDISFFYENNVTCPTTTSASSSTTVPATTRTSSVSTTSTSTASPGTATTTTSTSRPGTTPTGSTQSTTSKSAGTSLRMTYNVLLFFIFVIFRCQLN
ncbi:unnamed protein product [Adineta ricciae]|uniref:Sodefrin repeats C n=1 Tax=Adineta ricciae TaxID=249248 RepID=A0A814RW85_ADIRI|nr:unnamed protein product [Adineta ricciae]